MLRNLPLLAWTQSQILEAHVGFATSSAVSGPLWKSLQDTAMESVKTKPAKRCVNCWVVSRPFVNLRIPKLPLSSTLSVKSLISCDVRKVFLSSGNGLNSMVMAFENGVFCPILNLPGPFLKGTSAITSHRGHAVCWALAESQLVFIYIKKKNVDWKNLGSLI